MHSEGFRMHSAGIRMHSEGIRMHSEGFRMHSEGLRMHSEGIRMHLDCDSPITSALLSIKTLMICKVQRHEMIQQQSIQIKVVKTLHSVEGYLLAQERHRLEMANTLDSTVGYF